VSAVLAAWLILAGPGLVQASIYSALTYGFSYTPPQSIFSNLCWQSGVTDPAKNYGQVVNIWAGNPNNSRCDNGNVSVQPNRIGISVSGYRDGAFCGSSSYYTNSVFTSAWQLWITLCSDPAGQQFFTTTAKAEGMLDNLTFPWVYGYTRNLSSPGLWH